MAFKNRLRLFTLISGKGTSPPTEQDAARVWAEVTDMGVTTKYAAAAAGVSAELQAVMYRREYGGQTHAEYSGVKYKISSTGRTDNDLHIKLILSRG